MSQLAKTKPQPVPLNVWAPQCIPSHRSRSTSACPEAVDPLLNNREGASLLNVIVPTFWRRVADGTIPRPIKLGALSRWPQSELLGVIERAKAARNS